MAKIRNEELVQLAGEVLPERTVLSAVPMDGGPGGGSANFSPFCSPNNQSNTLSQSILAAQGANNQCGLSNTGKAAGISLFG